MSYKFGSKDQINPESNKFINSSDKRSGTLKLAYVMQNTGVDLASNAGAPILVKWTIRGLQAAGYNIDLIALKGSSVVITSDISRLDQIFTAATGISSTRLFKFCERGVRRIQQVLKIPYFAFVDTFRFYEACRRCLPQYDLCHEYQGLLSPGAALACLRTGTPYVLTVDADIILESAVVGKPLHKLQLFFATLEAKLIYKLANKIICVSEPARQHFIENWNVDPTKIVVVPNGVDTELFQPKDRKTAKARLNLKEKYVVSFVGSFQLWHGLENLVESFDQISKAIPEARLLLVGDGPARTNVEQKITELNLESKVIITGLVPQTDVPEMLAATDVAVIPYPKLPQELWFSPLKLYEYMAAGKAIVASRDGQIAQVIQHGDNGLLTEPGNVDELAQAIIKLLKNSDKRFHLERNVRKQAVERHSWDQYIKRLEEIYHSVL